MRRKIAIRVSLLALLICMCAACGRNSNKTDDVTPTAEPTVTTAPTAEPTATPDPEKMSLEELVARNREIHETVLPKVTAHPLGTAPLPSGQEKQDMAYGITRAGSADVTSVDMETGEEFPFNSSWDYAQSFYLRIDGLKDAKMQELVNERLESVARAMQDRAFLPSASGIMPYIKEWGLPKGAVHEYVK